MGITLKNVTIDNCGTGISTPSDAIIHADGLVITNTRKAIEIRNPATLLGALGLPENTPPELLIDALRHLRQNSHLPREQRVESLRETQLLKWLGAAADLVGLGQALLKVQEGGFIDDIIRQFGA
jgi:hypothetical protein